MMRYGNYTEVESFPVSHFISLTAHQFDLLMNIFLKQFHLFIVALN